MRDVNGNTNYGSGENINEGDYVPTGKISDDDGLEGRGLDNTAEYDFEADKTVGFYNGNGGQPQGGYPAQNGYTRNNGYNETYPGGTYPGQRYTEPNYGGGNNTGLIAAISVLSAVVIIGLVVLVLMFTGVLTIGKDDKGSEPTVFPPVAATPAPTQREVPHVAPQQPTVTPKPENVTVARNVYVANVDYSIYFRSEPAENDANIICEIPLGTMVGFIENTDSVFAKIKYNGQVGYAKRQYLSDQKPEEDKISDYMYVANVDYSIYFRSEPAENSSNIICEIPLGTMVGFVENTDSVFAKIIYNGRVGYVKREYLSYSKPSSSRSSSSSGSTMTVVNVEYAIYLRSSPSESSDSNIIMEIPVGATVSYLGTPDNTFYKISYAGTVGYAKQIYLSFN